MIIPFYINCTTYLDVSQTHVTNIVENCANGETTKSKNCKSQPVVADVAVHIDTRSLNKDKQFGGETSFSFLI